MDRQAPPRFQFLSDVLDTRRLSAALPAVEEEMFPTLTLLSRPVERRTITGMRQNYSERLHKTVHIRTAYLESSRSRSFRAAQRLGITSLLQSESLAQFAERATGWSLVRPAQPQVICYCAGDYAGPHNDHHPEDAGFRGGYVDVQITITNGAVAHQYLVYEKHGHFSESVDVARSGGIAVYYLPFWHFTTPLVAKPGREREARRWLLLATFQIERRSRRRSTA